MGRVGRLLVVGGVAAGLSAAARARRAAPGLEITVIEQGAAISHAACGVPFVVSGEVADPASLVPHTPESFANEHGVRVLTRHRATEILHSRRSLVVHDLEAGGRKRIEYDRLVLATGAEAKIPFKVRSNVEGLFTVRNLDDALALTGWLEGERPAEAAVIGAGIQGLEWVDALLRRGLRVTLIERRTEVATRCDRAIGALVRERLGGRGVRVMTGAAVEGIKTGSGRAIRALATDGGKIECGVAVVACGVAPRVELALTAGIILDPCGAIAVDGTMQTNVTGIYAAGDCVCVPHLVTGSPYYQPTGALAVKTGRIAGTNAAGKYAAFSGALGTQAVVAVDYELGVTGLNLAEAELLRLRPVAVTVRAPERARYIGAGDLTVHLVGDAGSGRLIGAQLFGARGVVGRLGTLTAAISARLPIEELAMLDLPYAPKASPVWDPLHIAAGELLKKLKS
jgi:NADPH-dependent 2,4-dienoyl-CoA reductase/sulfur reductase-like enzyme